jgi:hypothetical protein
MTDELDPTGDAPTPPPEPTSATPPMPTDPTTRVEAPVAPIAPLTPAGRENPAVSTYEHEVAWSTVAPATPVVSTAPPRRRSRLRWAVSLALVALIIATTAAVAAIITGRSTDATVLGYVPANTTLYGEVRLDLPGDQRRAVGEFLSHFPGFADQSALESKLDQVLDDFVKKATDGSQTYTTDIKPWFGGELAASLGPLPPASALNGTDGSATAMGSFRALALISITDPAAAQAWLDGAITKTGAKTTSAPYDGATLTLFDKSDGLQPALAIVGGKVIVAGDLVSVKAAIDTNGEGGFSNEPGPKAALASMDADHVGFAYLALRPLLDWSTDLEKAWVTSAGASAPPAVSAALLKAVPDWGAYALRFENDAIVMEATAPVPETRIGPTDNRRSTVAEHIPANALVASISDDLGATLKQGLALYRDDASLKPVFDQLDQGLGLIGGADAALGWAGDSAVVVTAPDGTPEGGIVVVPTDKAAADHLFTALRSFIALGGAQQGITVHDETYNGATITTVNLGDISKLAGAAGAAGAAGLPTLPSGSVEIAYAVTDQVVVVGSGPAFVKHVLDTTKDTSLASDSRYKSLADRAGNGTGSSWVDITAIRGLIEKNAVGVGADPAAVAKYQSDIKPFLAPFDALYASSSTSTDLSRSVIYITVK